jgi:hypothetical protein
MSRISRAEQSPFGALFAHGAVFFHIKAGAELIKDEERSMTPFLRDRYRCWGSICRRYDGLGNDTIGGRFGEASAQSQEAKRCCVLCLKS